VKDRYGDVCTEEKI